MMDDLTNIWVEVKGEGFRKLVVGGIYREHQLLNDDSESLSEKEQFERWCRTWRQ